MTENYESYMAHRIAEYETMVDTSQEKADYWQVRATHEAVHLHSLMQEWEDYQLGNDVTPKNRRITLMGETNA